jgi:hypothetical protein
MKVDKERSAYHEADDVRDEFNAQELRRLRLILRRLRFLESQVRKNGGLASDGGGGAWTEWEIEALEWVLTEVGFLRQEARSNG